MRRVFAPGAYRPGETRVHGIDARAKIVALLDDLLPAGLSDQQKSKRVSNLLTKMKNVDRTVDNDGVVGKAARWRAV